MQKLKFFIILLIIITTKSFSNNFNSLSNIAQPYIGSDWRTIHSKNFDVHYEASYFDFAKRMIAIAEIVYAKEVILLQWKPKDRIQVVINSSSDESNGGATPVPYNQFFIHIKPPIAGELMDHTGWIELVFSHELVHILHLDQVAGVPKEMRSVFGRSVLSSFPQDKAPSWVAEGIAVHYESIYGLGRANGAHYHSKMRQEVMKGPMSYSEQVYTFSSRWPGGNQYFYGSYFFEFVRDTYGEKAINRYIQVYSKNIIGWRMDSRSQEAFGKGIDEIWDEYRAYLYKKFTPEITMIKNKNHQSGKILVNERYVNSKLNITNNNSLVYVHKDLITKPSVIGISKNGIKTEILNSRHNIYDLAWHKRGLLLVTPTICNNYKNSFALHYYDFRTEDTNKINDCIGILNTEWQKDGQAIYATQIKNSTMRLIKIQDLENPIITTLFKFNLGEAIGNFDISSDATEIVASVKREQTGWNLEIFNLQNKTWHKITHSAKIEYNPKYAGGFIYYTANTDDRKQIELYRLNINKNTTEQLTNSLGYVSDFVIGNDNSAWLSIYTGSGEQIKFIKKLRSIEKTRINFSSYPNLDHLATKHLDTSNIKQGEKYSALSTITPTSWMPLFSTADGFSFFGAMLFGSDVLGFHSWKLSPILYYDNLPNKFVGTASYNFYNMIRFDYSKSIVIKKNKNKNKDEDEDESITSSSGYDENTLSQLTLRYPMYGHGWLLNTAIAVAESSTDTVSQGDTYEQRTHNYNDSSSLSGVMINFSNAIRYFHNNNPIGGMTAYFTHESYFGEKTTEKPYQGTANILRLKSYFQLNKQHSLRLAMMLARGDDTIKPFQLGDIPLLVNDELLHRRNFGLPGYDKTDELQGTNVNHMEISYFFPVININNGFSVFPFGVGKIHGKLTYQVGELWDADINAKKTYPSQSLEFNINYRFYGLPMQTSFGYYQGLEETQGKQGSYFKMGTDF